MLPAKPHQHYAQIIVGDYFDLRVIVLGNKAPETSPSESYTFLGYTPNSLGELISVKIAGKTPDNYTQIIILWGMQLAILSRQKVLNRLGESKVTHLFFLYHCNLATTSVLLFGSCQRPSPSSSPLRARCWQSGQQQAMRL